MIARASDKDFQDWLPAERLAEEYIAIGFYYLTIRLVIMLLL